MSRGPVTVRRWAAARSGSRGERADGAAAARTLDRVATLVAAGVPPARAWALVGGFPDDGGPGWEDVAAVLRVAERTGAPSAGTVRALAAALRRSAASDRAVLVALAGPRASARIVLALPLLGLVLGSTWGSGAVRVLVASPIGWTCLLLAAVLVALGRTWSARLVRAAIPDGHLPGVLLDAWAVAVSGGGSWAEGGAAVRAAFADRPWRASDGDHLRDVLALAQRAGVPAATLLRAAAEDVRDDAAAAGLAAAERLAVRLVLPLGVCVLPAFVLVGVVPVVAGVLSSTVVDVG